jgi:UDP-glucose 4-epimerase
MSGLENKIGSFKEKSIIITGAAGFIGSNLVDYLLEQKAEVIGIDNFFSGRKKNLDHAFTYGNFNFIKGDIRNRNRIFRKIKKADIIFHLAAITNPVYTVKNPIISNDVNVTGTLNILELARAQDVEKFIFSSSAAVYGNLPDLPKSENMPLNPISPYGVSKMASEAYINAYHELYGLNTTILRYFNVYGPRQVNSPYSGVVPIFLSKLAKNENITIFGDGNQTRDFIYIKDIIKSNIQSYLSENSNGKIINIASGEPCSINKLVQLLSSLYQKKDPKIIFEDERKGDILHSYGDNKLAREIIGFEPEYDIKKGLEDYIGYLKKK